MKIFYSILTIFLFYVIPGFSQTSIPGGNVSGTWSLTGSPYNIQGSIMIPDGSTLIIDPGVTVNFVSNYQLQVNGCLHAIGTSADSIIFTAVNLTLGWEGIRFPGTAATNDSSKIIYCKLEHGRATGSSSLANGGALNFNGFSKAIVSNCLIKDCMAKYNGGGIYCENSNIIISNNIIYGNSGDENGTTSVFGDFGGGGIFCKTSNPLIYNNIISNNKSFAGGAGIACWYSNPIISNNIISNNYFTSVLSGGGIYCWYSNPLISNNTISNNIAGYGGGIFCRQSNPVISNNTITNNEAYPINSNAQGGAIYCTTNSNPLITNNTFANNRANYGGVLYCTDISSPVFLNCILWGDTALTLGAALFLNDEDSDPDFFFCNIQDNTGSFELNGNFYTGSFQNNIDTLPYFVAPSAGNGSGFDAVVADWSLQSNSPCINIGNPVGTYPATDKAGNVRVIGGTIDMGAYESQAVAGLTSLTETNTKIHVYPNPFSSQTTLSFNTEQKYSVVKIIDMLGKEIETINFSGNKLVIEKGTKQKGIYFFQITDEKKNIINKKIIIQ